MERPRDPWDGLREHNFAAAVESRHHSSAATYRRPFAVSNRRTTGFGSIRDGSGCRSCTRFVDPGVRCRSVRRLHDLNGYPMAYDILPTSDPRMTKLRFPALAAKTCMLPRLQPGTRAQPMC